ncbi:MAG: LbtU family siderophore porin [bacterium]
MASTLSRLFVVLSFVVGLTVVGSNGQAQTQKDSEFPGGVSLKGHIHALATSQSQDLQSGGSNDSAAIDVNSIQLGLTASPHQSVDASVVWLLENGLNSGAPGDGFAVDQAYVTISGTRRMLSEGKGRNELSGSPLYTRVGKFYVPFGTKLQYHTFDVVSLPQSLQLSETLESQIMLGYTPSSRLNVFAGLYSGAGPERDDNQSIDDFYLGADVQSGIGSVSATWTNNINNSSVLAGELSPAENANGGLSVYGRATTGPAKFQLQYVSTLDKYTQGNFNNNTPSAITTELTLIDIVNFRDRSLDFTFIYEVTDGWFDHPETTQGAVVDVPLVEGVTVSTEYVNRDFDPASASRLSATDVISFRLATGFSNLLGQ